ncbi:MAG TPA: reverse transcriptase family protein [Gaiellaceae bacterium]|nr:reverse transcriptase family protein [Gaiellaceae bacterium]
MRDYEVGYLEEVRAHLQDAIDEETAASAVAYARNLIEHRFPPIFDSGHLAHVVGVSPQIFGYVSSFPEAFYSSFRIAKRGGGSRLIEAPTPALKRIQHWIQRNITSNLWSHDASHGFVRERSIVTNAAPHVRSRLVLKIDLRDFFGTVEREQVYRIFRRVGYTRQIAGLLTSLTTKDGHLPQGAPTSPDLANHAAYVLDVRLSALAHRNRMTYTRYADDLTFSGPGAEVPRVRRVIEHIIRSQAFSPQDKKERFMRPSERQSVTGITVNEKLTWPRDRRRWLRQEIYYLRKYGLDEHLKRRRYTRARYKEFIYGHAYALHSVQPELAKGLLAELDLVDWNY